MIPSRFVLGSRSPRRLELLRQIVPAESIEVLPPRSADEAAFDSLCDWPAIECRLVEIAQAKCRDVLEQMASRGRDPSGSTDLSGQSGVPIVIAADTIVIVCQADDRLFVLGQPPIGPASAGTVARWFRDFYAGKTHTVATALCVAEPGGAPVCRVVTSSVTFRHDVEPWLGWYLSTGEPAGKAGGYAIQGAGSVFVTGISGSISNVIGLPLEALLDILHSRTAPGDRSA